MIPLRYAHVLGKVLERGIHARARHRDAQQPCRLIGARRCFRRSDADAAHDGFWQTRSPVAIGRGKNHGADFVLELNVSDITRIKDLSGDRMRTRPVVLRHSGCKLASALICHCLATRAQLVHELLLDRIECQPAQTRRVETVLPEQHSSEQQGDYRTEAQCGQGILSLQAPCGHFSARPGSPE